MTSVLPLLLALPFLMAALIAVGLIAGLSALGDSLDNTFQTLSESLTLED